MARRPVTPARKPVPAAHRPEENPARKVRALPGQLGLLDRPTTPAQMRLLVMLEGSAEKVAQAVERIEAATVPPKPRRPALALVRSTPRPTAPGWPRSAPPRAPVVDVSAWPAAPPANEARAALPVVARSPNAVGGRQPKAAQSVEDFILQLARRFTEDQKVPGVVFNVSPGKRNGLVLRLQDWPSSGPPLISAAALYSMALSPNSQGFSSPAGMQRLWTTPRTPTGEIVMQQLGPFVRAGLKSAGLDVPVTVTFMPAPFLREAHAAFERAKSQTQAFRERGEKHSAIVQRGAIARALEEEEIKNRLAGRAAPTSPVAPVQSEAVGIGRMLAERLSAAAGLQNAVWDVSEESGPARGVRRLAFYLVDYDVGRGPALGAEDRLPYLARTRNLTPARFAGGVSRPLTQLFTDLRTAYFDEIAGPLFQATQGDRRFFPAIGVAPDIYSRRLPELIAEVEAYRKGLKTARRDAIDAVATAQGPAVPESAGEISSDRYYTTFTGSKYDRSRTVSQIGTLVRAEIARAIENGEIPAVRTKVSGSDGSVNVEIIGLPPGVTLFGPPNADKLQRLSENRVVPFGPEVDKAVKGIEKIIAQYRQTSDDFERGGDYRSSNFYTDVSASRAVLNEGYAQLKGETVADPKVRLRAGLNTLRLLQQDAERLGLAMPEAQAALDALADVHHRGAPAREAQSRLARLKEDRTRIVNTEKNLKRQNALRSLFDLVQRIGSAEPVGRTPVGEVANRLEYELKGVATNLAVAGGAPRSELEPARARVVQDYQLQVERGPRNNPAHGYEIVCPDGRVRHYPYHNKGDALSTARTVSDPAWHGERGACRIAPNPSPLEESQPPCPGGKHTVRPVTFTCGRR